MHGPELAYMKEAFETNWMSTVGANINEVEKQIAEKVGCKYAVALSCGTAALHLCVKLAGVKPGDKVLCSDMTFAATVNPVVYEKATPVFIDTERETWNMDPVALEKAFELHPEVYKNDIYFQNAELSKVDTGGGGTIAHYAAEYGMNVLDCGVSVMSMHALWEVTSAYDIEQAYKCYKAFLELE